MLWVASVQGEDMYRLGERLVTERCAGCHHPSGNNAAGSQFSRISEQRKSPEGWFMTVVRMQREGRVQLTQDERRSVVKYLSDNYGLTPTEALPFRHALEKRPNRADVAEDPLLATMCARCHTQARFQLQRRSEEEWRRLVHFHVGQFPTLEYAAGSRDRDWWGIATGPLVTQLTQQLGLQMDSWKHWQQQPSPNLSGRWRIVGRQPGRGVYYGYAEISKTGTDQYRTSYSLTDAAAVEHSSTSSAVIYSGYEWRGERQLSDKTVREVFAVSDQGNRLQGRWFFQDHDETGGDWTAVRVGTRAQVLAIYPNYLKAGSRQEMTLIGTGLKGPVSLGKGISVTVKQRSEDKIVIDVVADRNVEAGRREIQVGDIASTQLSVYRKLDSIQVRPAHAIARIGDGGGKIAPVPVQFEAVGFLNGADGLAGTEDDITVGRFPAHWSSSDFDDIAKMLQDSTHAGQINQNGLFQPAAAGINPDRYIPTNNIGVLNIQAELDQGDNTLSANARLVVTVQRFIDPPIR
jgi:quinohemoprotein amine dehydrogenase